MLSNTNLRAAGKILCRYNEESISFNLKKGNYLAGCDLINHMNPLKVRRFFFLLPGFTGRSQKVIFSMAWKKKTPGCELPMEATCKELWAAPSSYEWSLADWLPENMNLSPTTTRKWVLPTTTESKCRFFLQSLQKKTQSCWSINFNFVILWAQNPVPPCPNFWHTKLNQ